MTLIQRSTLVTAPGAAKVDKYNIAINGKVNGNEVAVDDKADALYKAIYNNYTTLNKYFQAIATEYKKCASKSVKGQKLMASLKNVANKCKDQGNECIARQKKLKELYTKALTEKNTNELNNAISSITGLKQENKNINENYTTLNNNYSTLQNNTAELKKNYDELQGNYNSLQGNYTNLQNSYNTLNDNYNEVSKRIQTLQEMVDRLSRNSK